MALITSNLRFNFLSFVLLFFVSFNSFVHGNVANSWRPFVPGDVPTWSQCQDVRRNWHVNHPDYFPRTCYGSGFTLAAVPPDVFYNSYTKRHVMDNFGMNNRDRQSRTYEIPDGLNIIATSLTEINKGRCEGCKVWERFAYSNEGRRVSQVILEFDPTYCRNVDGNCFLGAQLTIFMGDDSKPIHSHPLTVCQSQSNNIGNYKVLQQECKRGNFRPDPVVKPIVTTRNTGDDRVTAKSECGPPLRDGSPRWKVLTRTNEGVSILFCDPAEVKLHDGASFNVYSAFSGSKYFVKWGQGISVKFRGEWAWLSL